MTRIELGLRRPRRCAGCRSPSTTRVRPGSRVTITVSSTERITGTLTDFSNGLPDLPGMSVTDRPEEYMPAPFDFRDPTVVRTLLEL